MVERGLMTLRRSRAPHGDDRQADEHGVGDDRDEDDREDLLAGQRALVSKGSRNPVRSTFNEVTPADDGTEVPRTTIRFVQAPPDPRPRSATACMKTPSAPRSYHPDLRTIVDALSIVTPRH